MRLLHSDQIPDSLVARWDARWKLAALVLAALGIASLEHLAPAVAALVSGLLLIVLARLSLSWVLNRLGLFAVAALPYLLVLPVTLDPAGAGWDLGPVHISQRGLVAGLAVLCRCLAIGCATLLLIGTAPFPHTLAAAHHLWVPGVLVLVIGLAYRYTFLLSEEFRRIRVALRTRGFHFSTSRHGYRTLGHATGALLVRGSDRADRVAAAMRCRGFTGTFRTTITFRTHLMDIALSLVVISGVVAIMAFDHVL